MGARARLTPGLQISGQPANASPAELVSFLKAKCARPFRIKQEVVGEHKLTLLLENKSQAYHLADLSGIRFRTHAVRARACARRASDGARAQLSIVPILDPTSMMLVDSAPGAAAASGTLSPGAQAAHQKQAIRVLLVKRYDMEAGYLNLDAFVSCDEVRASNIRMDFNLRWCATLVMHAIQELFPSVCVRARAHDCTARAHTHADEGPQLGQQWHLLPQVLHGDGQLDTGTDAAQLGGEQDRPPQ